MIGALVAAAVAGYLLGSCPNGYLISRSRGLDIRKHGSGNIGATNVLRVLGKKWGYLVFFLDALKGLLAAGIGLHLATQSFPLAVHPEISGITGGLFCILGHTFPVWLGFRGGKGVATSAGVLLGLMPLAVISVLAIWLAVFYATRYVSVASIFAALALPPFVFLYLKLQVVSGWLLLPFSALIAAVVVWRHRSNMRRLMHGTEERFGAK
jgi:glycerol-3-phosphate acyltransferase PlsY